MEFQLSYFKFKRWCWESAALNMPAKLENSAVATGLEKVSFHCNPKKVNAKECSNYRTIALISYASKVMSLLFNMLSRLVITFLARCKRLLISWLQSPSAVILEAQKIKSASWAISNPKKMMLWKCCTQYVSKLENSAMATGLEKVSFHCYPKEW